MARNDAAKALQRAYAQLGENETAFIEGLLHVYQPVRPLLIFKGQPEDMALAHARMGGDFDLAILDGDPDADDYPYDALEQLLPFLEESAYVVVHHAAHHRVMARVEAVLAAHPDQLTDCGMIGRTAVWDTHHQAHYGGLQLLRYTRTRRLTVWAETSA